MQYWTSRGIAVLDVNYGGSTGFGRAYRDRLHLSWGVVDVDDCVAGARFLAERGRVDGKRCVISGGSAGGYTTLAALDVPRFFPGRGELLRRQRRGRARARHAQVRVALSRLADRTLPAGGGALSRALAPLSCGAAVEAGDLLPGRGGRGRAAEPGGGHGRGAAAQGQRRSAISCFPASSTASARPPTSSAAWMRSSISMRSRCLGRGSFSKTGFR